MPVNDAVPSFTTTVVHSLADYTGIPVGKLANIVVVYETTEAETGVVANACCPQHTVHQLASGIAVILDKPIPGLQPCDPD